MNIPQINYYELEPEDNIFQDIVADVTHRCNMSCKNCYIPNRNIPDMNVDKLIECISKLPKKTMIRIIGAEPTMRSDLPDIIKKIKQSGHRCTLLTNGLKLSSKKYVQELKQSKLSHVYLSLNGIDNDDWYEKIDEMRCAKNKIKALENIYNNKFILDTGTIIVKDINEEAPARLIYLLQNKNIINAVCRFKNVGQFGRYMKNSNENYKLNDLINLLSYQLKISTDYILNWKNKPIYQNLDIEEETFMFPLNEKSEGKFLHKSGIWIKIADWDTEGKPTAFPNQTRRGRITENFKIAPFFEHMKLNEFGY